MQPGDHFAGRRIDAVEGGAVDILDIFAVDEMGGWWLGFHLYSPRGKRLDSSRLSRFMWLRM
jgi:hypothetical protein